MMRSGTRRLLLFFIVGFLGLCTLPGQTKAQDAVCRFVSLGADWKGSAQDIAQELAGIGPGISVKAASSNSLLACAGSNAIDGAVAAIKAAAGIKDKEPDPPANAPESHHVRLYFNRNASALAEVINGTYPTVEAKALGPDLLVFKGKERADEANIHELKRWIALMDSPRPEITLNAWSVQVSAPRQEEVEQISRYVRTQVAAYNEQLKRALQRGWVYLSSVHNNRDFPKPLFSGYVLQTYEANTDKYREVSAQSPRMWCGDRMYCLGYGSTFTGLMQPTLSNFIGVLAAAKDPNVSNTFVDALEGKEAGLAEGKSVPTSASSNSGDYCENQDEAEYQQSHGRNAPLFHCLRQQLTESLTVPVRLALLRTAMADFLFQYKFSQQYPHAFEPFEYTASAQVLDAQLDPLLSAFNRDMAIYLRILQNAIPLDKKGHVELPFLPKGDVKFLSNGIVTVRTVSGTDASVDSTTQNAFRETPPPLVQEFVKNLKDAEQTLPGLISANPAPHAAAALTAFLSSGQSPTISLGRDLNLQVTPISLQGASSAELKVHLEAKDDGKPQRIKPDGTSQDDTTDRVADHTVDTNIRVDSLGLFEVSTLSAELSRANEPIPLLPPFVQLPYIGSFLQYKPKPGTMYHRSLVILSATILPTAADLLNGLRFEHDRLNGESIVRATNDEQDQTAQGLRAVHKRILYCIAEEANPNSKKFQQDVGDRAIDCKNPGAAVPAQIAKGK